MADVPWSTWLISRVSNTINPPEIKTDKLSNEMFDLLGQGDASLVNKPGDPEARLTADVERKVADLVHEIFVYWRYEGLNLSKLLFRDNFDPVKAALLVVVQRELQNLWNRLHDPIEGVFIRHEPFSYKVPHLTVEQCALRIASMQFNVG